MFRPLRPSSGWTRIYGWSLDWRYHLQGESSSLSWLTKGKQLCKGIPSWTQLYCQIYKYLNYMFRPLRPSSVWTRIYGWSLDWLYHLQGESSSLSWLTKGKQLCKVIPSWTQLYCQIYKYLNYIFRSLRPSSGWNLKMDLRAETCSWDIYISDNIVVFKTVYPCTIVYL